MLTEQRDDPLFVRGTNVGRTPEFRVDVRVVLYALVTMLVVSLAGWLYLQQATRVADEAHAILQLERDKQERTRQIVGLRAQVARLGSLQRLHEEADRLYYTLPGAGDTAHRWLAPLPSMSASVAPTQAAVSLEARPAAVSLVERLRTWLDATRTWWRTLGARLRGVQPQE